MYSLSRNSCAKAFGNWSRRSDLRSKKSKEGGVLSTLHPPTPPPSLRPLGLMHQSWQQLSYSLRNKKSGMADSFFFNFPSYWLLLRWITSITLCNHFKVLIFFFADEPRNGDMRDEKLQPIPVINQLASQDGAKINNPAPCHTRSWYPCPLNADVDETQPENFPIDDYIGNTLSK